MMLIEKPIAYITTKPPNSEFGNAKPVINVERAEPKKKKTTSTQRAIPMKILSVTSNTFKRIGTDESRTMMALTSNFLSVK